MKEIHVYFDQQGCDDFLISVTQGATVIFLILAVATPQIMNNRTHSQPLIHRPTKPRNPKHPSPSQALHQSQFELASLQQKVSQSKPILLTIYDKVKLKQQQYQSKIKEQDVRCQQVEELGKQYRNAYHDALKIMQKNRVVEKFQGMGNYRSVSACQLNAVGGEEVKIEEKVMNNYQSVGNFASGKGRDRTKIYSILSQYQQKKKYNEAKTKQANFFGQSVYQRYRSKIQGQSTLRKQNSQSMLNKVRRLSQEIDKDITKLKAGKDSKGSLNLLKEKQTMKKQGGNGKSRKEYFAELQRRKLKLI